MKNLFWSNFQEIADLKYENDGFMIYRRKGLEILRSLLRLPNIYKIFFQVTSVTKHQRLTKQQKLL